MSNVSATGDWGWWYGGHNHSGPYWSVIPPYPQSPWYVPQRCPSCGHCPTCGRGHTIYTWTSTNTSSSNANVTIGGVSTDELTRTITWDGGKYDYADIDEQLLFPEEWDDDDPEPPAPCGARP